MVRNIRFAVCSAVFAVLLLVACNAQQPQAVANLASAATVAAGPRVATQPATQQPPSVTPTYDIASATADAAYHLTYQAIDPNYPPPQPPLPNPQQTQAAEQTELAAPTNTPEPTETALSAADKMAPDLVAAISRNPNHVEFFFRVVAKDIQHGTPDPSQSREQNNSVYEREITDQSQAPIKALLDQLRQEGKVVSYKSYSGSANELFVKGTAEVVQIMAARSDTLDFSANGQFYVPPTRGVRLTTTPVATTNPTLGSRTALPSCGGWQSGPPVPCKRCADPLYFSDDYR